MIMAKLAPLQITLTPGTLEILELLGRSFNRLADVLAPLVAAETNTQPKTPDVTPQEQPHDPQHCWNDGQPHLGPCSVAEAAPYAREDVDDEPTEWPAAAGEDSAGETHNPQRHDEFTLSAADLERDLFEATTKLSQVRRQRDAARRDVDRLLRTQERLERTVVDLRSSLDEATGRLRQVRQDRDAMEAERDTARQQLADARRDYEQLDAGPF